LIYCKILNIVVLFSTIAQPSEAQPCSQLD
jgi:hypothetical protein